MAAMSDQASDHVAACTRLAPGRPSGWPPVIGLPDGAQPVAVVGADEPQRPVLCIHPMTAGDARYAEGRRAGLREAAALLRDGASLLRGGGLLSRAVADGLRQVAERTEAKAGEP